MLAMCQTPRAGWSRACRAYRTRRALESRLEGCYPAGRVHGQYTIFENGKGSGAKQVSTCSARIDYVATRSRGRTSGNNSIDIMIPLWFFVCLVKDSCSPITPHYSFLDRGTARYKMMTYVATSAKRSCCRVAPPYSAQYQQRSYDRGRRPAVLAASPCLGLSFNSRSQRSM